MIDQVFHVLWRTSVATGLIAVLWLTACGRPEQVATEADAQAMRPKQAATLTLPRTDVSANDPAAIDPSPIDTVAARQE